SRFFGRPGKIAFQFGRICSGIEIAEVPFRHGTEGGVAGAHERSPESGCRLVWRHNWPQCAALARQAGSATFWSAPAPLGFELYFKRLRGRRTARAGIRRKKSKNDRFATIRLLRSGTLPSVSKPLVRICPNLGP